MDRRPFFRIAAAAASLLFATAGFAADTVLHHVHGVAFTPDGKALMVPAHVGLAVYESGRWRTAPGARHDFMGFSVARDALYTSGHPAPGSALPNPLGLMKSSDRGESWKSLALLGESDFHQMAAGYESGAIYVLNPHPNSRMRETGLYVTRDEGESWQHAPASGLAGKPIALAAHPTEPGVLAVASTEGLYLSKDFGKSFRRIGPERVVTAVAFDFDGRHLRFATEAADKLHRVPIAGGMGSARKLPPLSRDYVLYIAQSPSDPKVLAVATAQRDVYLSRDAGSTWRAIARQGQPVDTAPSAAHLK